MNKNNFKNDVMLIIVNAIIIHLFYSFLRSIGELNFISFLAGGIEVFVFIFLRKFIFTKE